LILIIAVVAGLIGGLIRAYIKRRQLSIPYFRAGWLVPAAFIPQALCFFLPVTSARIPNRIVAVVLVLSQLMLLIFAWLNLKQQGFLALGLGVVLNVLVITANGGWMPISPQTLRYLNPDPSQHNWVIGQRLGVSKDIVLPYDNMIFPLLSDRIIFPKILSNGLAYSIGDIFIALGAFQLLYSVGGKSLLHEGEVNT
jgi:hypothetical protein